MTAPDQHAADLAALSRLEAEFARLEERANFADAYAYRQRAEAAEAEVTRLREGLRQIAESGPRPRNLRSDLQYVIVLQGIARSLLADKEQT